MRKVVVLALGLAALGTGLGLGGFILSACNSGSCPAIPLGGAPGCDHQATFFGTTFWIGATSTGLEAAGAFVLASGLVVYLSQMAKPKEPV